MFGFGVYFNVVTNGGGGPPATEIFTFNSANPNATTEFFDNATYDNTYIASGDWAWSVWVKMVDTGAGQTLLRTSTGTPFNVDVTLMYNWTAFNPAYANQLAFGSLSGGATWTSSGVSIPTLTDGNWHHIIIGKVGSTAYMYHNLDLVMTQTSMPTPNNTASTLLGTHYYLGAGSEPLQSPCSVYSVMKNSFPDAIDRANLYNEGVPFCLDLIPTVTKDKIDQFYNLGNFTGSTGNETDNLVDGTDNFTNQGGVTFDATGLSIECLDDGLEIFTANTGVFSGTTVYLGGNNDKPLGGAGDFHVSIWVKFSSTTGDQMLIDNWTNSATTRCFELYKTTAGHLAFHHWFTGGAEGLTSRAIPVLNTTTWTHLAAERVGGDLFLYQDGVQIGASEPIGTTTLYDIATTNFTIGALADNPVILGFYGSAVNACVARSGGLVSALYHDGVIPCWEILGTPTQDAIIAGGRFWPIENHTDFTGQERIDQTGNTGTIPNNGVVFTGTAQIECEA